MSSGRAEAAGRRVREAGRAGRTRAQTLTATSEHGTAAHHPPTSSPSLEPEYFRAPGTSIERSRPARATDPQGSKRRSHLPLGVRFGSVATDLRPTGARVQLGQREARPADEGGKYCRNPPGVGSTPDGAARRPRYRRLYPPLHAVSRRLLSRPTGLLFQACAEAAPRRLISGPRRVIAEAKVRGR